MELPLPWAVSSAEGFAQGGVEVLTATGLLDVLAFGSECGDTAALLRTAKALEGDVFQAALRAELTKGDSFAAARQRAVAALLSPSDAALLSDPNNTLGIEYCRALLRVGAAPALFTIPRTGAAHDVTPENTGGYSASAIRHLLAEGRRADALSRMVPAMRAVYEAEESAGRAPVFAAACERAILARLRSMTPAEFDALDTGHEGVGQRLYNASRNAATLDAVLDNAKTKRYAYARLRRMVLWAYLGLTPAKLPASVPYLLGSKADSSAWGFVILGHYPLDWGSARAGGKVLKAYLDGGSVTIGGETVSFAGKNGAVCYGNFHGHLHNFKTSKIYVVPDNVSQSNPPTEQMAALRICCPSANYYRTNEVGENDLPDSNRIEFGEEATYSKAPGATDTAFTVNVIDPAEKKLYSFCYGAGYDRTLSFDFAVIMRAVRTALTGCSGSNAATAVEDGAAYTTTLTPKNGYTFDTVRVSMGGTDITATAYNAETGVVSVARVTGDITITATASKPVTYTNVVPTAVDSSGASLPYQEGYNLSSSGAVQEENGFVTTGFIPLSGNVTKHIYRIGGDGIIFSKTEEHSRVGWYDSTFQLLGNVMPAKKIDASVYYPNSIPESTTAMTFQVTETASNVPASAAYFRVSAKGKGANLIITIDEPIE